MENKTNVQVSVIMPALNEEENIAAALSNVIEAFNFYNINGEIVVINDGSTDKTQSIIDAFSESRNNIKTIKHGNPFGIGVSFWEGVDVCSGSVVVMLPGDNENDSFEILRYYKLLEHVDMVIPFNFNAEVRPMYRNALSFIYRFIINSTFLVNFRYTNGTILYRKSILEELTYHSDGFFFQTDILIRLAKRGYLFAEVPYKLGKRKSGLSKAITFPSLIQVIKGYCRLVGDFYFKNKDKYKDFSSDSITGLRRDKV